MRGALWVNSSLFEKYMTSALLKSVHHTVSTFIPVFRSSNHMKMLLHYKVYGFELLLASVKNNRTLKNSRDLFWTHVSSGTVYNIM